MRRNFLLIDNLRAGRGQTAFADRVVAELNVLGAGITRGKATTETDALEEIRQASTSEIFHAVVAAGGDGTIRLAAKALAGSRIPLGIIPQGTGNVLAHELALPRDPSSLARLLVNAPAQRITPGTANGEPFLLMAGVGFDGRVIGELDHRLKIRIGKLAYAGPALKALRQPPDRLAVWIDGKATRATWAIVANARRYGGAFVLAPRTHILQPGLEAVLFHGDTTMDRVRILVHLARGRLDRLAERSDGVVSMRACTHVRIESAVPVPSQIDGDQFLPTPLEIRGDGPPVWLIVPPTAS